MASSKAGGTASLVLVVAMSLLLAACAGTGGTLTDDDCAEPKQKKTVKLEIKLKGGVPDKVDKDDGTDGKEIHVCPGDYVVWTLKDSEFNLQFRDTSAGKVPFNWVDGKKKAAKVAKDKWELIEVVREDVDRGVGLKYDVVNPAGRLDPLIIVER